MKLSLSIASLTFLLFPAWALATYSVRNIDASQCEAAGHTDQYSLNICPIQLNNGDRVVISGTNERSNLIVTRGNRHNNDPYYMALGIDDATHSVEGAINVVLQNNKRHALIYRLNYTRHDGQTGYQIVTVQMGRGRHASEKTCTRFVFDSNSSTSFTHLPEPQREQAMRDQALAQVQTNNFQNRNQSCMEYEHNEEAHRPATVPRDPNEGDNLERAEP